jgi:hypothetical protein
MFLPQTSAKPTQGVWGHAPRKYHPLMQGTRIELFISWLQNHSIACLMSHRPFDYRYILGPKSAKRTQGVWGRAPRSLRLRTEAGSDPHGKRESFIFCKGQLEAGRRRKSGETCGVSRVPFGGFGDAGSGNSPGVVLKLPPAAAKMRR